MAPTDVEIPPGPRGSGCEGVQARPDGAPPRPSGRGGRGARGDGRSRSERRGPRQTAANDTHESDTFDPKKASGARARRRRGATFKPKLAPRQMSDELVDLLVTALRAPYQGTKQIRELMTGSVIATVKAGEKDPLVVAAETENKNYARA
eukprot:1423220-Pyramimonas_sp.AAC.1